MNGKNVRRIVFLVFFFALFLLVARIFYPFMTILLWSILIYMLLLPLYRKATRQKSGNPMGQIGRTLIAALFSVGGVLLIALPLGFLTFNIIKEVGELYGEAKRLLNMYPQFWDLSPQGGLGSIIDRLSGGAVNLSNVDLRAELSRMIAGSTSKLLGYSGAILKNALSFIMTLAFIIFTLYFFFMDGEHLISVLISAIPIEHEYTRLFISKLRDTARDLVGGYFVVALYQAFAAFVIFFIFKVKGSLLLAALTGVASFIPMAGAGLVWLPVSLVRMAEGNIGEGIALLLLSALFISTLDNFIRPLVLTEKLKMHPLLIFFAILGGIELFGFNGLILGPLILILFFTAAGLYDQNYRSQTE